MALDIKKIIKQEVAKVMLEQHLLEAETPDHFGGGKNIDVFGYQTEHFDICKSAVMLFEKLKEKNLEGMAVDHAKKAAQHIDKVFEIEKDVVEEGSAAPEQMEEAVDNNMLFGYEIGALSMHIDEDLTRDTAFHKLHIMEIANRFDGSMTEYGANTTYGTSFAHGSAEEEVSESKINEISTKAGLEDVIKGRTSAIEGIKMSKDLAQGFQQWIAMSPYGRKYGKHINKGRIASVIGPANAFGIERYLSPKAKKEFKDVYKKHGPKREVNEKTLKKGDVIKFKNGESIRIIGPKGDGYDYQGRGRERGHHPKKWFNMMIGSGKAVVEGKVKEAAPGYMHDCASRVVHMEHGSGTCIPEQHNLVKEGKKWIVTKYDVKFDSGKIVRNVPVNELKIVSESHHGHKRRKKKKTNEMKVTNHKGENITKYVLQLLQGKINKKQFEKLTGLKKDKMKELAEKLVFYRDEQKRLRRFDTDKAANRRLSR